MRFVVVVSFTLLTYHICREVQGEEIKVDSQHRRLVRVIGLV